ncbi:uncharacterized protein TRUGW13939_10722 [Talaromyces rugulosus]|uniref:HNH nuclease domain-containing protein n=1 Tax=Talaromyces rugulosus TaxID=121627 RepID=A0A7H8RCN4_TALRU|nr:uncharacterized protein TRUGW13939_10722 [Talaromyces rugulosus]QKX63551.1 hypothetical protein TRUGW13939_10722 [Talaromyces rugulosus]
MLSSSKAGLSPDGRELLTDDVSECANDEQLRQLVRSIETGLLIPLKAQGGKTPTDITPSPRPGVEDSIENLKTQNIEPITGGPQSQLRHHCLERDGYKCVATGRYSGDHAHPQNAPTTYLEAAHIIPFALGSFQPNDGEAMDRHAKIWVNLRRFFPVLRRSRASQNHACIGNFLHMSGQAEIIDKVLKDFEDCGGLASDGSSNLEDLLAVSRLSLLHTNVNEMPDSKKPTEKQRHMEKSRPMAQQGRQRAKRFDSENQPWGYDLI